MLWHSETDFDSKYGLQNMMDNIALPTQSILDEINQVMVKAGHRIIKTKENQEISDSCNFFILEAAEYVNENETLASDIGL